MYIISLSSASLAGAAIVMLGTERMKARSNTPWCVTPSSPTRPARSRQNMTGSRWMATS